MTINYTTLLGLAQPVTGTEQGTWGDTVNTEITALLEDAIADAATFSVTSGDVTLTSTAGQANQARMAILLVTGTPGVSRNIIAPSQSKWYIVKNSSDASVVLKGSATTGVTILAGTEALCFWNGSDFEIVGVNGPSSSTDNAVVRFDGTTGKVIQNSGVIIDDSNNVSGMGTLGVGAITSSSLTSGRVLYAGTSGLIQDSANLTFNGTTLTANTIGAFTLGGTISGGGNQINNIVIGASTPLAGSFTTLSASGVATFSAGTVSAPAITTTGDTNTGIFFPAADTIAATTGGTERMRIDSSGNVGIGVTPSAWDTTVPAIQMGTGGAFIAAQGSAKTIRIGSNAYYAGGWKYYATDFASNYQQFQGQHQWYTAASGTAGNAITFTQAMTLDASGNLGIGTSSPTASASNKTVTINGPSGSGALIDFKSNETLNFRIFSGSASSVLSVKTATPLIFDTNDTERMRIDSGGNVGIGTSSPSQKLQVVGTGYITDNLLFDSSSVVGLNTTDGSDNGYLAISGASADGSDRGGFIYLSGNERATDAGSLVLGAGNTTSGTGSPGVIAFRTGSNTERARITSGGNFLIGATATVGGTAERLNVTATGNSPAIIAISSSGSVDSTIPTWNKATSGDNLFLQFYTEGAATLRGSIDYNRGAGQTRYNITSDATLKNIIGDANGQKSLEILNSTRIREYAWKNDPTQKPQIGVIAQELYETYKGAVSVGGDFERERDVTEEVEEEYTDEEGNTQTRTVTKVVGKETYTEYRPWGVDKTAFTFHLIAGWQAHEKLLKEAMTRIEALEAEVAAMKGN